jgi:hypothetical protein
MSRLQTSWIEVRVQKTNVVEQQRAKAESERGYQEYHQTHETQRKDDEWNDYERKHAPKPMPFTSDFRHLLRWIGLHTRTISRFSTFPGLHFQSGLHTRSIQLRCDATAHVCSLLRSPRALRAV